VTPLAFPQHVVTPLAFPQHVVTPLAFPQHVVTPLAFPQHVVTPLAFPQHEDDESQGMVPHGHAHAHANTMMYSHTPAVLMHPSVEHQGQHDAGSAHEKHRYKVVTQNYPGEVDANARVGGPHNAPEIHSRTTYGRRIDDDYACSDDFRAVAVDDFLAHAVEGVAPYVPLCLVDGSLVLDCCTHGENAHHTTLWMVNVFASGVEDGLPYSGANSGANAENSAASLNGLNPGWNGANGLAYGGGLNGEDTDLVDDDGFLLMLGVVLGGCCAHVGNGRGGLPLGVQHARELAAAAAAAAVGGDADGCCADAVDVVP